jgi:hypothetical protein
MSFSDNIKKWVSIDDEIRSLSETLKQKRHKRNEILSSIIDYKSRNGLDGKTIKYNDETIRFSNTRQYQGITYNFIKTCLDELLEDKEQISLIIEYIKNKRQYKTIEDLKRYI